MIQKKVKIMAYAPVVFGIVVGFDPDHIEDFQVYEYVEGFAPMSSERDFERFLDENPFVVDEILCELTKEEEG